MEARRCPGHGQLPASYEALQGDINGLMTCTSITRMHTQRATPCLHRNLLLGNPSEVLKTRDLTCQKT